MAFEGIYPSGSVGALLTRLPSVRTSGSSNNATRTGSCTVAVSTSIGSGFADKLIIC